MGALKMVVMNPRGELGGYLIQVTLFQRSQHTYCTCNPCQTVTKGPCRSSVARSGTDAMAWVLVAIWGVRCGGCGRGRNGAAGGSGGGGEGSVVIGDRVVVRAMAAHVVSFLFLTFA